MDKIDYKKIAIIIAGFLGVETLSFFAWPHPVFNGAILAAISLAVLVISIWRLEYGFLALIGELLIGSMGHLFFMNFPAGQLPLRIAMWCAFMAVFAVVLLIQIIREGKRSQYLESFKQFGAKNYFLALGVFIIAALVSGLVRGHSLSVIFSDFNSWLFFLLVFPAIAIYGGRETGRKSRLRDIFLAGAIWMSVKTLIFLYIFTHDCAIAPDIYTWLRKTLTGEMTPTGSGWPRIFIQGQIYAGIAFFLVFWKKLPAKRAFKGSWLPLTAAGLFFSTLLISFSRSFWAGLLAALLFTLILVWHRYSFKKMAVSGLWLLCSAALGLAIIYAVAAFPYIYRTGNFGASFLDRVSNGNEAAVASRWSLLPALMEKIKEAPLVGQGYGATVTYRSSDPRVLATNPDGIYTTYAFEWGYLELWLKLGLLGLAAYLCLLGRLVIGGAAEGRKSGNMTYYGLAAGLVFLAVTNIFTPYLNHPLGIGIIVISSCLIPLNKIY